MDLITSIFMGPVIPATVLLGLLLAWSALAILGAVDFEFPGIGANLDADIEPGIDLDPSTVAGTAGVGLIASRWLNIGSVPLVLWLGTFGVTWWFVSAMLWVLVDQHLFSPPGWLWSGLLVIKNIAIAVPVTKIATNPMRGWFVNERLTANSIIGKECTISSLEASPEFGQVKFKTDGAPLLLNVRTDGPHLAQGSRVWITHYDAKRRVYIVSPTGTDTATQPQDLR